MSRYYYDAVVSYIEKCLIVLNFKSFKININYTILECISIECARATIYNIIYIHIIQIIIYEICIMNCVHNHILCSCGGIRVHIHFDEILFFLRTVCNYCMRFTCYCVLGPLNMYKYSLNFTMMLSSNIM